MKTLLKKIKYWVQGRVMHKPTLCISQKWIGNQYGGFYVHTDALHAQSIVYSIGIGEDISFDQELIKTIGCPVFGYDPTPKSIAWVTKNMNDRQFKFFDFGIAKVSGKQSFYLPENKNFVSGSIKPIKGVDKQNKVALQFKTLKAAMELNNHTQIDLLKMDIEGAEYGVFESFTGWDRVGVFSGELHQMDTQGTPEDLYALFTANGFDVKIKGDDERGVIHMLAIARCGE